MVLVLLFILVLQLHILTRKRELIALLLLSTRCLSVDIPHGAVG